MEKFEHKHGENDKVTAYHSSRRMFCVYQNRLIIADKNLPYSHFVWFKKEGWITKDNDRLIDEMVRGIVDEKGDIYVYTGHDFRINDNIELVFFSHLPELAKKLELNTHKHIFGGMIRGELGTMWRAEKDYGEIGDNIK